MKRSLARAFVWCCAVLATLLLCHMSYRLRRASNNYVAFNTDEADATFSQLVLYAAHVYMPPSYDACINRLRRIDEAKLEWAIDTKASPDATPSWANIQPYLAKRGGRPRCPMGGVYGIGSLTNPPTCSVKGHSLN